MKQMSENVIWRSFARSILGRARLAVVWIIGARLSNPNRATVKYCDERQKRSRCRFCLPIKAAVTSSMPEPIRPASATTCEQKRNVIKMAEGAFAARSKSSQLRARAPSVHRATNNTRSSLINDGNAETGVLMFRVDVHIRVIWNIRSSLHRLFARRVPERASRITRRYANHRYSRAESVSRDS